MAAPLPPPRRRNSGTVVVAVVLVLLVGLSGVGAAGWAAWSFFQGDDTSSSGAPAADPPEPSATTQQPSYPDELARFYEQDLNWTGCGSNDCAALEVPLDYAEPNDETIKLAVLRAKATNRGQRVGQLVVNPGGPGGSGVQYAAAGLSAFGDTLTHYFDIVGFDPRGVGASTPLECADTAQTDELLRVDPDPDNPEEVARLDAVTRSFGQGCLDDSGDLARHMSTVEVAKDLDVLRGALGEAQLDYFGASYGTLIGATYADLFPTHVRRMVLDGAIDPALSTEQLSLGQAKGFETALRAYLQDCVDGDQCVLGDTVDEGARRIANLMARIDADPLPTSGDREVTQGLAFFGIVWPLYNKSVWPLLTSALSEALEGRGDRLLALSDQYTSRGSDGYTTNSMAALLAVNCLDHNDYTAIEQVPDRVSVFRKASPTFGRIFAYGLSTCQFWPVKSGERTKPLEAAGAAPIVVIGTTRDPATPYSQSVSLAEQLESGILVSRDGDGHTGFNQGNPCVDAAVEAYLVSGTAPKDGLAC
jgi:pimeloyl-ACP methyl ester carboxylesterase